MKKKTAILLLFTCIPMLLCGCTEKTPVPEIDPNCLEVYCFSAGAADAFLLTAQGTSVLIDTGEAPLGEEILSFLAREKITKLDGLIITHFDRDHVGGAADVLKGISVGTVLQGSGPADSKQYDKYKKALKKTKKTPYTVTETVTFSLGGAEYTVRPPQQSSYAVEPSNNSSLIVTVEYGESRLLFMGDAEDARIAEYLQSPQSCDFIKIPHHGRWHENLPALLEAVRPKAAVITSSEEEPEDTAVMNALSNQNVTTYLTDIAPVLVRCDADGDLEVTYIR